MFSSVNVKSILNQNVNCTLNLLPAVLSIYEQKLYYNSQVINAGLFFYFHLYLGAFFDYL
ncbi:hypothetical protein DIU36_26655 [Mucilaginibacter rubeus]|nr:hypothetical protein DIU36_26655 [Mucilaginibacter rubeus]